MSESGNRTFALPANTPEKAPVPSFDPKGANYFDMFAPQYFNLETVQALMKEGGGPLLKEVERVAVEYVFNPEHGEDSGDWKPVVHFVGGGPALVLNQTRAKVLMQATRSIHVSDWQQVGWLELAAGIDSGRAQLVISPTEAPAGAENKTTSEGGKNTQTLEELNKDFFG